MLWPFVGTMLQINEISQAPKYNSILSVPWHRDAHVSVIHEHFAGVERKSLEDLASVKILTTEMSRKMSTVVNSVTCADIREGISKHTWAGTSDRPALREHHIASM